MIIKKLHIEKFRGFNNVECNLGSHITVISGQNGTQKTTMLGIISQPFSISLESNPMHDEKPLSGGNFKSGFSEKFKLSKMFDKPGEHEWTLDFRIDGINSFTMESIRRTSNGTIRFRKKGSRQAGDGYLQFPVIFLSLKRLFPIGEDSKLKVDDSFTLTENEQHYYISWYKKILLLDRENISTISRLYSPDKVTAGINTDQYDWQSNSAGQDNIGKILLAILSFKRLKEKYDNDYKGGILAIDELDATLFPASQVKLFEALNRFSEEFNIQIIFTTHSLELINAISKYRNKNEQNKENVKLLYLEKKDGNILVKERDYDYIKHNLEVTLGGSSNISMGKINVYTEDAEGEYFAKRTLGGKLTRNLNFIHAHLGCKNYLQLLNSKIPEFMWPNSLIILDGDARDFVMKKKKKNVKNVFCLPGNTSPERILAEFIDQIPDESEFRGKVDQHFTHQYCFSDYTIEEIRDNREKAKKWFNSDKIYPNLNKILNEWMASNKQKILGIRTDFTYLYNEIAKEKGLSTLH